MSISDGYVSDNEQDNSSCYEVKNMVETSSFYKKQKYMTPLERAKLKRSLPEIRSPSALIESTSSSSKKQQSNKKNKKSSPKVTMKQPKPKAANGIVNKDIDPMVFLSKKCSTPSEGSSKKFFKSRSSNASHDQIRSVLTCKSIAPVDMKAVKAMAKDQPKHTLTTVKPRKVLSPIIHYISSANVESSSSDSDTVANLNQTERTASKWIKNSFASESVNDKENCSTVSSEITNESFTLTAEFEGSVSPTYHEAQPTHLTETGEKLYPVFDAKQQKVYSPEKKSSAKVVRKTKNTADTQQLMLDAGQKQIGATQCSTCSMIYHIADEADERLHQKFHDCYLVNLNFPGWKKEKVIGKFPDGRIVMVTKDDQRFMLRKVDDILTIVNKELGIENLNTFSRPDTTHLIFISMFAKVIGFLTAESISAGYWVELDESNDSLSPVKISSSDEGKVKAVCGINRLWVAASERRNRIATRMLDCLRCNFYYGYLITTNKLAFLDPSTVGRKFASSYVNKNNKFIVYK